MTAQDMGPIKVRCLGPATEADTKLALADKRAHIVEWERAGFTFVMSTHHLVIVKSTTLGGDVRTVEAAWKYANPFAMVQDWNEIKHVANVYRISKIHRLN